MASRPGDVKLTSDSAQGGGCLALARSRGLLRDIHDLWAKYKVKATEPWAKVDMEMYVLTWKLV